MKKKEIIDVIKNIKTIQNSKLLPLYDHCSYDENIKKILKKVIEENKELNKQYEIDSKALQEYNNFKSSCKCNHDIRKKVYIEDDEDLFHQNYFYECVFCGHTIPIDSKNAGWYERHNYGKCVYFENNESNILDIILKILEDKDDDEEIDLVEEFKKLDIDQTICRINDDKRPENYIMIIDNSMIAKEKTPLNEILLLDYLSKLDGVRVNLFSKSISYNKLKYGLLSNGGYLYPKDMHISSDFYFPFNSLEKDKKNNIPYKIIINLSPTLTMYDITREEKINIDIVLKETFPNSSILTLPQINDENLEEILNYIEKVFRNKKEESFKYKKKTI